MVLLSLYYHIRSLFKSIDHERMDAFNATSKSNLRSIPFSRKVVKKHTKQACFQSGWLWKECEKSIAWQDPLEWNGKWKTVLLIRNGNLMKISRLLKWYWKFVAVQLHVRTVGLVRTMWNVLFFVDANENATWCK